MEYFSPPDFSESQDGPSVVEEVLESFSSESEESRLAESYVPNILEDKSRKKKKKIDYSRFNSAEFNEVDTLLTNVEEYSQRIREDVDKYARNVRNETDLFRSEIELELAKALIKRIEAEKQAREILKNAEDSRDAVLAQGRDEGFQAGFAEGLKQQKNENEQNTLAVMTLLDELKNLRNHQMQKNEEQLVNLCLLIAQKVVHQDLSERKEMVLDLLTSSMKHFEGLGNIKIKVHPVEYDFIAENQAELEKYLDDQQLVSLKADQSLKPSEPLIESDFTVVELSLSKQFKEIGERLNDCVNDRRVLFK